MRSSILLLFTFSLFNLLNAQTPAIRFEHFTTREGLPMNNVKDIQMDMDGFLWFATDAGLSQYDGYDFNTYLHDPQDSNSLGYTQVRNLMYNNEGNLWINLYGSGLDLLDKKHNRFIHYNLAPKFFQKLLEDKKGNLWVGNPKGIWSLKKGDSTLTPIPELGEIRVNVIYEDRSGMIWIGSNGKIVEFDPDQESSIEYEFYGPANSIFEDHDGDLWIGGKGLTLFNREKGTFTRYQHDPENPQSLSANEINVLHVDSQNNLWVGTWDGLNRFDKVNGLFTRYHHDIEDPYSVSSDIINDICEDRSGNLWIATTGGGVNMLRGHRNPFFHYRHEPDNPRNPYYNSVTTFFERPDGNVWIGTGEGLNLFNRKNGSFIRYPPFSRDKWHGINLALFEDQEGYVWLNSSGGAHRLLPSKDHSYIDKMDFDFNASCFFEDSRGHVWIAGPDGLWRYDRNQDKIVKYQLDRDDPYSLQGPYTTDVFEDHEGNIWICGGTGLYLYDLINDHFVRYLDYNIIKVGEYNKGNMFIVDGTGIYYYNWKTDSLTPILEHGKITSIGGEIDDHGDWWSSTHNGIFFLNPETKAIKRYVQLDGLQGDDFIIWSSMKSRSGEIYFGGHNGFTVFHPDSIKDNPYIPPIVITDFFLSNQSVPVKGNIRDTTDFRSPLDKTISYTEEIVLPYSQNVFSFEFTALNYVKSKSNMYKYKMAGFNEAWMYTDASNRVATYTNLSPGKYVFTVTGSNDDGIWNEEGKSITVIILPPWWLTLWAKTGYALLFISGIWGFIYLRTRQQKKKLQEVQRINTRLQQIDKLKDQFLANTSHELRTPLQGIIGLSESLVDGVAGKLSTHAIDILKMVTTSGKRLGYLVNDILDFSKLKNHELTLQLRPVDMHAASDVVLTLAGPLMKNKPIELINNVPRDLPFVQADENRVQQILQNLVGNAIKFTDEGSITISAKKDTDFLDITVSDTGIGIAEEKQGDVFRAFEQADGSTAREYGGTGIGLSVTKQLVELHGGSIQVSSEIEKGSHFTFSLPLSDAIRETVPELKFAEGLEETIHSTEPVIDTKSEQILMETDGITLPAGISDQARILVVDDEPVNLEVLKNHLSMAGYQVILANDGVEALEILKMDRSFDLILLDIMMPKLSGYEVCNKLRDIFLPSELPVVMLTAKNRVTDLVEGFEVGANDYLTKPFSKEELLSRIKMHLQLHRIHRATGKFVPFEFLRYIGRESIVDVQLGDQSYEEVSILFCDIRDYTSLSEKMIPEENFRFINAFVGRMGPIIKEYQGFVNQFMGDAIMAIFPKDVSYGLKAAIAMQQKIEEYNQERVTEKRKPIQIGIGLHTGPLIMGIIGDKNRSDPTTIADSVNIASRMEGMTKYYGSRILISQDSYDVMTHREDFHFRYLGEVLVKGKHKPVKVYECFDGDEAEILEKKKATAHDFQEGLDLYFQRDFPEASVAFNNIIKTNPEDNTASYYYKLAARYASDGVSDDWNGVEKLEGK